MREGELSLIERAKRGDRQAFRLLVEEYEKKIYGLAYRLVGNHHDADEVAQNTFIRLYRSLDKVQAGKSLYPWLYRVATNYAIKLLKQRQKRQAFLPSLDDYEQRGQIRSETPGPGEEVERKEMGDAFSRAITTLPPKQRVAFILFEVEGLSLRETAAACRASEGTIKWRIYSAKEKLRAQLREFI